MKTTRPRAVIVTALALAMLSTPFITLASGSTSPVAQQATGFKVQATTFKNNEIDMSANLYFPAGFDASKTYATVVVVHPGGGVKEQTAGLYAQHLAESGIVALTFDASHQGASGGMPRFLENPAERVEDVRSAVDYLTTLSYVDASRIGALGICAGGGYAIKASSNEQRIKAVATVSAVNIGAATRRGWNGDVPLEKQIAPLQAVAKQRTAEANGAAPMYVEYVPAKPDASTPNDLREASEYYLTPRGQYPTSTNKMLFTSLDKMYSFDAFDQVGTLLTQPLLLVAGSDAGSLWHSQEAYSKAKGKKELYIVPGATHMSLYDAPKDVDVAVGKISPFFLQNL
ncbi:alpha/beta hydrolase [Stenotrophomonas bentonitica]|uniref:alpha/beta hydrolase n=1 Tax=Stenotrophomonas bentonitica TaxID=1450134 RepID=UPI0036E3C351